MMDNGILFRSYLSYFVTLLYEKQPHSVLFCFISDHPLATTALSVTGYLLIDCTWISVYLITSELFPTVLRWVPIMTYTQQSEKYNLC